MIQTIKIPQNKELLIVGDVHEKEWHFNKLLEYLNPDRILVSIGDVYDKGDGPQASQSIISKIKNLLDNNLAYMVRGNHEQRYNNTWCKSLPLSISFLFHNHNRVTVLHAGVSPKHSWQDLSTNHEVMYIRNLDETTGNPIPVEWRSINGIQKVRATKIGPPWHEFYDGRFGYIVSGHQPQSDGLVKYYKYSANIDTQCYKTGILTGLIIANGDIKEQIQVKDNG
jgi:hypothetical protein